MNRLQRAINRLLGRSQQEQGARPTSGPNDSTDEEEYRASRQRDLLEKAERRLEEGDSDPDRYQV